MTDKELSSKPSVSFRRVKAKPSPWTFEIPQIRDFIAPYVGNGKRWADPFSGKSTLCEYRNDLNKKMPAKTHLLASEWVKTLPDGLAGVLFDPPYSCRQVSECYRSAGLRARKLDTSSNFYTRVRVALAPKVQMGGHVLSFGWNSVGFGEAWGYEVVEGLLVSFGGHHNDTICTAEMHVERKEPPPPEKAAEPLEAFAE